MNALMENSNISPQPVVVHTPSDGLLRPKRLWQSLVLDLAHGRSLIWEMFIRDLISEHRRSLLGLFSVLAPTLITTGWAVLFRQASIINVGDINMPYPFFVLQGMMIWSAFIESIDAPISGVLAELSLISKSDVAPEIVTIARLGRVVFNIMIKMLVIFIADLFYQAPPALTIVFVPLCMMLIMALGVGIGLILAPLNILYRDVSKMLPIILTFWFFATPVLYASAKPGAMAVIAGQMNPVTPLLETTRILAFGTAPTLSAGFVWMAALSLAVLMIGTIFHRIAMPIVIDRANV